MPLRVQNPFPQQQWEKLFVFSPFTKLENHAIIFFTKFNCFLLRTLRTLYNCYYICWKNVHWKKHPLRNESQIDKNQGQRNLEHEVVNCTFIHRSSFFFLLNFKNVPVAAAIAKI